MSKLKKSVFLLFTIILLVSIYLSSLVKNKLHHYLEKASKASIGKISFNFFTGSIILEDFSIENIFEAARIVVKPELRPLLHRQFVISKALLDKPVLILRKLTTGGTNNNFTFPAKEFLIKDGTVIYIHEFSPGRTATAEINGIFIRLKNYSSPISYIQGIPLYTRIKGRGNLPTEPKGAIFLSGNLNLLEPQKSFTGDILLDNISLTYFNNFYPEGSQIKVVSGEFSLKTRVQCKRDELKAKPNTTIKGLRLKLTQDYATGDVFELPVVLVVDFFDIYREELKFTFEVTGTLSDPKFQLEEIVAEETRKVIGESIVRTIAKSPTLVIKLGDKLVTIADRLKSFGLNLGKGAEKAFEQLGKPAKELIKGLKGD